MARLKCAIVSAAACACFFAAPAQAATITTQFDTSDGFVTGDFGDVTLTSGSLSVTFSGGQQQQGFDLPSYNVNPAAYMFINGPFTGSFGGTVSGDGTDDDSGMIDFNIGVVEVSFFAANRGFGAGTTLNIFGVDDTTMLGSISITQTSNQASDGAMLTTITGSDFGGLIGKIGIDLPGPAGNPPYVLAIDSFSARVPEPGTAALLAAGLLGFGVARRRR